MTRLAITGAVALFAAAAMCGCYKDKDMVTTPTEPEYDLSDSQTDPIQHERYVMYRDYGVILIDDVKEEDYRYTMSSSSNIRITPSTLSQQDKLRAIELIRTLVFDAFPEEHIKRFPLKCIIGSGVFEQSTSPEGVENDPLPSYLGPYYFAFGISRKVLNEVAANRDFASSVLSEFVLKGVLEKAYGEDYRELFRDMYFRENEYRDGFYVSFGDMNPGKVPGTDNELEPADFPYEDFAKIADIQVYAYQNGVPSVTVEHTKSQYWLKPQVDVFLRARNYLPQYLAWAFLTPEEEQTKVLDTYPEFKKRYDAFRELMKQYVNIDL